MKKLLFTVMSLCVLVPGYSQNTSVLTHRYSNHRTGWNKHEKILNTSNVNQTQFGLVFTRSVDDEVYAQPLIVSDLMINGRTQNVVFVATVGNSIYAFNADDPDSTAPLWHVNLTTAGARTFNKNDPGCGVFANNIGIVGTPVIDTASNTMYVLTHDVSLTTGNSQQYIHAIDITTGDEKPGSPKAINAWVIGNGDGSVNDTVYFDQDQHDTRAALLLYNGVVYACWASFCDHDPYHGWVIGFDANTLETKYVYNDTPIASEGGIWMAGNGPSVDDNGYIYIISGNGTVGNGGDPNDPINRGESMLKFKDTGDSLKLVDFFTPNNYAYLETNDLDYGIGGAVLIPNSSYSVSNSKEGQIFLLDDDHLGKYSAGNDSLLQAIQVVPVMNASNAYNYGSPVYYHAEGDSEFVYVWGPLDSLKQFKLDRANNQFDLSKTITGHMRTNNTSSHYGPVLTVSSDDTMPGTAIVWAIESSSGFNSSGILEAFDARDVRKLLFSSNAAPTSNKMGKMAKFNTAVVANGKVYVPSFSNTLYVYGLLPETPPDTTGGGDTTGTNILQKTSDVQFTRLYPNPANNNITFEYSVSADISSLNVRIVDMNGRSLMEIPLPGGSGSHSKTVSVAGKISTGIYTAEYYVNGKFEGSVRFSKY